MEYFCFLLARTSEGADSLYNIAKSGTLDEIVKDRLKVFLEPAIKKWRDKMQAAIDGKAVEIYKSSHNSMQYVFRSSPVTVDSFDFQRYEDCSPGNKL